MTDTSAQPPAPGPPLPTASVGGFVPPPPPRPHVDPHPTGRKLAILALTALGVVYGDIGTSPLYAIKECFNPQHGIAPTVPNVYGVLSLIVWSLTLIVSVKYIVFILRADNRGEGGILALLALVQQRLPGGTDRRRSFVLIALGLFGAALLYGDGVITPAISVLGAIEGLEVATPVFQRFVVPITVVILFTLFSVQSHGTDRIGRFFGPVMCAWFAVIALVGAMEIARGPSILLALNPWYGVQFFAHNGWPGFLVLGAVILAVTGAEALYADMGHFGRRPIRLAWFALVFPALLVNYFGQGALLLRDSSAAVNPFYRLVPAPDVLLYPMVALATAAAVIASQALISGAFSLTRQALQLGYSPRVTVRHTSRQEAGQIFIPEVNTALKWACILLVIAFGSSSNLASAYGIAVTGTMVITTVLFSAIARHRWGWSGARVFAFLAVFLTIDMAFLTANLVKIGQGGWFPLVVGALIYVAMTTWKRGRDIQRHILRRASLPIELFLDDVGRRKPPRVPGTAAFMTSEQTGAPLVLLHHIKHNKVLHERVLLLSVTTADIPEVAPQERARVEALGESFYRVVAKYGFMEQPNVREIMQRIEEAGVRARAHETTFYLGRERMIPVRDARTPASDGQVATTPSSAATPSADAESVDADGSASADGGAQPRMALWRKKLFVFMSRNARSATEYFGIPPNRVVELGAQIEF